MEIFWVCSMQHGCYGHLSHISFQSLLSIHGIVSTDNKSIGKRLSIKIRSRRGPRPPYKTMACLGFKQEVGLLYHKYFQALLTNHFKFLIFFGGTKIWFFRQSSHKNANFETFKARKFDFCDVQWRGSTRLEWLKNKWPLF